MNNCYVGRGSLSVSRIEADRGFFVLSGESELTLTFTEDNVSVVDARSGVEVVVDWFAKNYRLVVEAECFRFEQDAIRLLLKSRHTAVVANSAVVNLPIDIVVNRQYMLRPSISSAVVVTDSLAVVVPAGNYTVDTVYGLIEFNNLTGFTGPYTVAFDSLGYDAYSLNDVNQIFVEAMFTGLDKASNRKVMAHFYRLALDITTSFKLIGKEYSPMHIRMMATPDVSQPLDLTLGQFGRIIFL